MLIQLYVRFDFLLIYGKHLDVRIFSLRVALSVYSTSLTRQFFIEVLVPSQEIERGNIYVRYTLLIKSWNCSGGI
jgi:hypothetical protein